MNKLLTAYDLKRKELKFRGGCAIALSFDGNKRLVTIRSVIEKLQELEEEGYQTLRPFVDRKGEPPFNAPILGITPIVSRMETDEELKARIDQTIQIRINEEREKQKQRIERVKGIK